MAASRGKAGQRSPGADPGAGEARTGAGDAPAHGVFHDALLEGISFTRLRVDRTIDRTLAFASERTRAAMRAVAMAYVYAFAAFAIVAWSVLLYFALYWLLMPVMVHEVDLFFDYDAHRNGPEFVPHELPAAHVVLAHADQQWTVFSENNRSGPPRHLPPRQPLPLGELYDVWVEFVLPESPHNLDLGPVMVETELAYMNPKNGTLKTLARSRRPLTIPYSSGISRLVSDVTLLPFRSLGFFRPVYVAKLRTIEKWREDGDARRVPSAITVTLSHPRLTVESARLYFLVQLYGLRYYAYHWPTFTFLLFTTLAIAVQFTALVAYIVQSVIGSGGPSLHLQARQSEEEEGGTSESSHGSADEASDDAVAEEEEEQKDADIDDIDDDDDM